MKKKQLLQYDYKLSPLGSVKSLHCKTCASWNDCPCGNPECKGVAYESSPQPIKFSRHFENCSAPICFEVYGKDGHDPIWYPSELLCLKNPLSSPQSHVRKVQRRINKLIAKEKFKYPDRAFTYSMLAKVKQVMPGLKGLNPERPLELKRFKDDSNALERTSYQMKRGLTSISTELSRSPIRKLDTIQQFQAKEQIWQSL